MPISGDERDKFDVAILARRNVHVAVACAAAGPRHLFSTTANAIRKIPQRLPDISSAGEVWTAGGGDRRRHRVTSVPALEPHGGTRVETCIPQSKSPAEAGP